MDIQEKQKKAFLDAYDAYADELFRFCILRTSDKEISTDILQDVFMKTWAYIQEGNEIENFRAFLYRIMRNLIVDHYRKKKAYSLDALVEEGVQIEAREVEEIDIAFDTVYDAEKVQSLLGKLPDAYREVIMLRYLESMSVSEIGEIIDESANNVSVRLHRAIKKLQEILETERDFHE